MVSAFERLGFTPVRHSYRMEIDLADATSEPVWPSGISVRTLAEGEERRIYEAFMEVWQDTSDPPHDTFEDWAHWLLRAIRSSLRCGSCSEAARSSAVSPSVAGTATIRPRDTSGCSASGALAQAGARPGAAPALVSGVPAARVDTRHLGVERRARPERPGSTSGPACRSTGTRSSSSGRQTSRVRARRASAPAAPTAGL